MTKQEIQALAQDHADRKITSAELIKMVHDGKITHQERSVIIRMSKQIAVARIKARSAAKQGTVAAPTVVKPKPEQLKEKMLVALWLKEEDQKMIDKLPELLGFKFCPLLFSNAGVLPVLEGTFVPPDYELAYLENVKAILSLLKDMLCGKIKIPTLKQEEKPQWMLSMERMQINPEQLETAYTYSLMPGGLMADKLMPNPVFARNLWLNILQYRIDDPILLLDSELRQAEMLQRVCGRLTTVSNAITSVKASIAEIQAQNVAEAQAKAQEAAAEAAVLAQIQASPEIQEQAQIDAQVAAAIAQQEAQVLEAVVASTNEAAQEAVAAAQEEQQVAQQVANGDQVAQDYAPQDDVQPAGIMTEDGDVVSTDIAMTDTGLPTQPNGTMVDDSAILYAPPPSLPQPITSDVPTIQQEPFYKNTTNQLIMVAALAGLVLWYNSTKKQRSY
jgi:hypothetical protein